MTRKPMSPLEIRRFMYAGKASLTMCNTRNGRKILYEILSFESKSNMWRVMVNTIYKRNKWYYLSCINGSKPDRLTNTTSKFKPSDKEWVAFEMLLRHVHTLSKDDMSHTLSKDDMSHVEITHNGYCGRCGRRLHDDKSVMRGFGPVCWKHVDSYDSPYKRKEVM